ncbi:hypothetical protein DKX38_010907 [Salix brachista]|uniref:starch synthase n=1 Tax=Salix brachista TaxID=2182728 RepID=A0A5N5LZL8_9ROSI|nr:hypothetical protein DKX38_010907 [Salix brachista]
MRRESGSTLSKSHEKKKLPSDNYGSFFGPSQPVISQRVIQESKSIIENQHLALSVSNAQHTVSSSCGVLLISGLLSFSDLQLQNKKSSSSTATGLKNRPHGLVPKVKNEVKTKVQKLKDTRDYSFLLTDDAELPAPTKELAPRNVFAPNSEARSAHVPQKIKQASSNSGRNIHGIREEGKPVFRNAQMHSKVGSQKPTSANKLDAASINSKRQLGSNNGTGPGRPGGPKCLPSKTPVSIMQKKASASAKKILPAMRKPLPSNLSKPSVPKQHWEQRKGLQEHSKPRPIPKQPLPTVKSQINKPIKQVSSHASLRDNRPKKKPVRPFPDACSDDEDAFSMLRKLIGNKNRGKYDDDGDDSDMEANFDDIMKEERRSARIAREEDEEQLRLIEEEERQERERKLAKKRKLNANGLLKEEEEEKYNDIWELFKEAQQNILYLNKQRLVAVEELNKANREKQLLLDKIQQSEAVNKLGNEQSLWWELLLRIDSMVLTGLIDSAEASGLRKTVMGNKFSVALVFFDIRQKTDAELLAKLRHFSDKNVFHIIQICTEMEPLVSVGSLSSYVTGLSKALQKKGHMVEVILPKSGTGSFHKHAYTLLVKLHETAKRVTAKYAKMFLSEYACLDLTEMQGLREIEAELYSYFNGQLHGNRIWTGIVHGIGVTLIQPLYYSSFFDRERVYGYSDDFERFTYFSRASLDYIAKSGKQPDVLHIHNWETAIVGPLFWDIFVKQCLEQPDKLALCGLDPASLHRPDRLQDHTMTHLVNVLKYQSLPLFGVFLSKPAIVVSERSYLSVVLDSWTKTDSVICIIYLLSLEMRGDPRVSKSHFREVRTFSCFIRYSGLASYELKLWGGLVYSNKVVIVSSMYSKERIISSFSHGLEPTLAIHKDKLLVSPCGFDNSTWDPSKDKFLPKNYSADDLKGKSICKVALQQQLGLSRNSSTVLVGCISTELLDFDPNIQKVVWNATQKNVQFIFVGSKVTSVNGALEYLQKELKDETMRFVNKYDEALLHLIYAGSDIILCQSFHDPLPQVPLKALKYGAAPVAVTSNENKFRHFVAHEQETTRFSQFISSAFGYLSLSQAVDEIKNNPSKWKQKIADAMVKDFSWNAECYDVHVSAYTAMKSL